MTGSVLGFGCGSALGRVGRDDSLRAMGAAWAAGVNVFDVAPSYGFGEAEALLGSFLAGRREQAVVVTKFGLLPRPSARRLASLKPLVRRLLTVAPGARSAVQRVANPQASPEDFAAELLRPSVEASLRALRTEYLDVLLLHGPPPASLRDSALSAAMSQLVSDGLVRATGLAASGDVVDLLTPELPHIQVLQSNVSPLDMRHLAAIGAGDRLFMANHVFGGAAGIARIRAVLSSLGPDLPNALRCANGATDSRTIAEVALGIVLRGTGVHVALPSMMNIEHLHANVAAINDSWLSDSDIALLRTAFVSASSNG